ncbi:MAG: element excision factor XisH family protein [Saprospiraceae bacterium]
MPRRDTYHDAVRTALETDGWTITDDPLSVQTPGTEFQIDLAAERTIILAEKAGEQIAVEIKSLISHTIFYDYYRGLGQFLVYRIALELVFPEKTLFLAIPKDAYEQLKKSYAFRESWPRYAVNLLIFNHKRKNIVKWIRF